MRPFILIAVAACFSLSSPADSFRLEGRAYQPSTNADIVWRATNDLPHGLWIYKVMPEAFSAAAVSNAMKIGRFEMKDLLQPPDKNQISFKNQDEFKRSRSLFIQPTVGEMRFDSQTDTEVSVEGVPTSDEAETLARDVLFQLGIDRSLLAEKVQKGYDDTLTKYDRNGVPKGPPQVNRRGVAFSRRIDGVRLSRSWDFLIHFGNHRQVENFSLTWRNILPSESHLVLTPDQFVEAIKSGKAVLPEQYGDLSGLAQANRLSVVNVTPRYYNGRKGEALDYLYPYADLDIVAEFGGTNRASFFLTCPIVQRAP